MTDAAVETASKVHLLEDVRLIERIKLQKIEIQKYLIDKIDKLEEDYLEMTLKPTSNGNVFNGWNKSNAAPAGGQKAGAPAMPKGKRNNKAQEKEREKIYMPFIRSEQEKIKDLNKDYKIEFVN